MTQALFVDKKEHTFQTVTDATQETVRTILSSGQPVEIEIGCGKAKFILARAEENPAIQYMAFDRVTKWMKAGIRRSDDKQLSNLTFFRAEARELLEKCIPEERIQAFYILFPDPWPKRRHRHRRLITSSFIQAVTKRLVSGGKIYLATDHTGYFEEIKHAVDESKIRWKEKQERMNERDSLGLVRSNFEAKYEMHGKDLFYLELVKP